jgi:hypothetical protein
MVRFDVYHQLIFRQTGASVSMELDGVHVFDYQSSFGEGRIGLSTHYTSARFDGIAITRHLSLYDNNSDAYAAWLQVRSGDWHVREGVLHGRPTESPAVLQLIKPEGMRDCLCRFDLTYLASGSKSGVKIEWLGLEADAIKLVKTKSGAQRVTLTMECRENEIQVWLDQELLFKQPQTMEWKGLQLLSDCEVRLEALEWTERA